LFVAIDTYESEIAHFLVLECEANGDLARTDGTTIFFIATKGDFEDRINWLVQVGKASVDHAHADGLIHSVGAVFKIAVI
jgi:hypothetical protein